MVRRLVVVAVVAALVVGVVGAVGNPLLRARQRNHFAAGHAAYLKGDCAQATKQLNGARVTLLDDDLAARAKADDEACAGLTRLRAQVGTQPLAALALYLEYLGTRPAPAMTRAARSEARALVQTSFAKTELISASCEQRTELGRLKVLAISPRDPLAPAYLQACGRHLASTDQPIAARDTYAELNRRFPRSAQARASVRTLAKLAVTAQRGRTLRKWPLLWDQRKDRTLGNRTRIVIEDNSASRMEFSTQGPKATFSQVPGCPKCKVVTDSQEHCGLGGKRLALTLPPGRYRVLVRFLRPNGDALDGRARAGTWTLKPGVEYHSCFAYERNSKSG